MTTRGWRKMRFCLLGMTALIFVIAGFSYFMLCAKLGRGLTKEGLLSVHPGMTGSSVLALLGEPISKDDGTWIYGRQSIFGNGLEIFINMVNGRVSNISVEDHDLGVYWYRENEDPVIWKLKLLDQLPRRDSAGR